jgi:hypothetical protein
MNHLEKKIATHYGSKFEIYGATPQGVDWKDRESQYIRFDQLIKVLDPRSSQHISINDLGCGYAELYDVIEKKLGQSFDYYGYDITKPCIDFLQSQPMIQNKKFLLIQNAKELQTADYTIASGIFNVKMDESNEVWLQYILSTIHAMNEHSKIGFSFNCLTSYSDPDKKRPDLYYADPLYLFDYLKKNISKNIALYHDYGLYDFTIIVKK